MLLLVLDNDGNLGKTSTDNWGKSASKLRSKLLKVEENY